MPIMGESNISRPNPEHVRVAAQQFERARQAMNSGNYDYSIELLRTCCKLDPGNLVYRKALRRTQKAKYGNNLRGSLMSWLTTSLPRAQLEKAKRAGDHLKVLELGEIILTADPWSVGTQIDMAHAAEALGWDEMAVWMLEQARQKDPRDARVNRALAELYERCGNFAQAMVLWGLVSKVNPHDLEAARKHKDLAAQHTIALGNYGEAAQAGGAVLGRETPVPTETTARDAPQRAVEGLKEKIAQDPTNPGHYLQLSTALLKAGKLDEARQCLEQGLAATGHHFELQLALGELEIEPFRTNLGMVQAKLASDPNNTQLLKLQAQLEQEINRREMDLFRQKADRYPTESTYRLELGIRLFRAGRVDEAIQELQTARKDPRARLRAHVYLGHCFRDRRNWVLARKNYSEALHAASTGDEEIRKELLFELARLAVEEGDWRTAVELGNELADLDFGYRNIGKLLDQWQNQLEKTTT